MPERRPIVLVGGSLKELPIGDTLPGVGGGGSVNNTTATVDFGPDEGETLVTLSVAAPWVTATSKIYCVPSPTASPDHTLEEALIEGVEFMAGDLQAGVGFTLYGYAPEGTYGQYNVNIIGI